MNHYPFMFAVIALVITEIFLGIWMVYMEPESDERVIIGSLTITIFIAFLVVVVIMYWIKKILDSQKI